MPARSVEYVFKGNFTNLTAGLTAAGRSTAELGTKLTALDKNGRQMRAGLSTLGSTAGKFGLVAAGGFALAIGAAARFDKAMSAVQAATHETASNMELLRAAAIKAGADTVYSATEAAGAIEELSKAGVSTADILGGGLSGSLNLAAAGAISVADAAELAATAMTQFKLGGDQVNHVADLLAAGAGKAQGGVDDLGMALKQSGLVAAQTGLSIEETTGALAEFAANGLIGSDAGTSFKTMLQALNPNSEKAANLMADLGLNAYDAQGNFVGLQNYAGQLQESLGKLSVEQQNAALKTIFGSDAVRAAAIIFKDGAQGVGEWQSKVNDAGYAAETASTRMDNLSGDVEQLKGSLETLLIGAGEGSQGPFRSIIQGATETVNGLSAIPGPAKTALTSLAGIAALGGGSLWFGSKVVDGIANMSEALNQLGIDATSTRSKIATIGTAGTAAALGLGTFLDTMGQLDSLQRSSEASDATVKSFQDLADALQFSNVGKYAADLHINLGRLTQDLADNGTQGEYAQRVLKDLGDSSHGFGALLKSEAGNILPFYTDSASKAYDANKDLKAIVDAMPESLGAAATETDAAAGATQDFGTQQAAAAQQVKKLNDAIRKQRDAARETASQFVGLGDSLDDTKVSLSDWIADLRKQALALRDFRVNAETAAKKGLREGLIAALQEAGPAGAMRLKQLADASRSEIGRANQAWASGRAEMQKYVDFKVPAKKIRIDDGQAKSAISSVRNELAQLQNKTITLTTIQRISTIRQASGLRVGQADGGTVPKTGLPYADRHPYMLADGEEIISNRRGQADRFRPLLKAINNAADGDTVGDGGGGRGMWASSGSFVMPQTLGGATAAIVELKSSIRGFNVSIKASDKAIREETKERDSLSKTVGRNQAEVNRVNGLYDSLSSSVKASLAANQFDQGSAWTSGGGVAGIIAKLSASTANATAMTAATRALSGSLTGGALQSVLEQGLTTSQMFAGLSAKQLASYQKAFDVNAAAVSRAGGAVGGAVYGAEQAKANVILLASQQELRAQTVELRLATAAQQRAERQRDHQEKLLGKVKDELADIRSELKKARGDANSGARSRK